VLPSPPCVGAGLTRVRETAIVRLPAETPNDRNDRGIRAATAWYNAHVARARGGARAPQAVLLTDDAENRRLAREAGLPVASGKACSRDRGKDAEQSYSARVRRGVCGRAGAA
jgi:hypothetical protein